MKIKSVFLAVLLIASMGLGGAAFAEDSCAPGCTSITKDGKTTCSCE